MVEGIGGGRYGAIHPDFKLDPDSKAGKVADVKSQNVRQVVITRGSGAVYIPNYLGSATSVKALDDGTYAVTTKTSTINSKPKTVIMSEAELVAKFGNNKSKFHAVG